MPTDDQIRDYHHYRKLRRYFPIEPIRDDEHCERATVILSAFVAVETTRKLYPSERVYYEDLASTVGMYRRRAREIRRLNASSSPLPAGRRCTCQARR